MASSFSNEVKYIQNSLFSSVSNKEEPVSSIPPEKESENAGRKNLSNGNDKKGTSRKNNRKTSEKYQAYQFSLLKFLSSSDIGSLGSQRPGVAETMGERPGETLPSTPLTGVTGTTSSVVASESATSEQRPESDGNSTEFGDRNESTVIHTIETQEETFQDKQIQNDFPSDDLSLELVQQDNTIFTKNYTITEADELGEGGISKKIQDNFKAIKVLKGIEIGTQEEMQKALVKYVGWGGIPQIFDPENTDIEPLRQTLKSLLSEKEFSAARRSTQDAHFTSEIVVKAIWASVERLGLYGNIRALEPAMGSGNFLGLAPKNLNLSWHGIELDPITAGIAKKLYPEETILNMSFASFPANVSMFNLVIGNPPFGQQGIFDQNFSGPKNLSIHNHFVAKSIDLLEPGGLAAFVVSRFFLDAVDQTAREYIASKADFLGAVRLPNFAFQKNALTKVTTDIVFFQKNTGEKKNMKDWIETSKNICIKRNPETYASTEVQYNINNWFKYNSEYMLGTMEAGHGMFQNSVDCISYKKDEFFEKTLNDTLEIALPKNPIYSFISYEEDKPQIEHNLNFVQSDYFKNLKIGSYAIEPVSGAIISKCAIDTDLIEVFIKNGDKNSLQLNWYTEVPCKPAQRKKIQLYIDLRDTLKTLFEAEKENNFEKMIQNRNLLNKKYDSFVENFGFLNTSTNHSLFKDDPESSLVEALEKNYSKGITAEIAKKKGVKPYPSLAEKADVFTQQVLFPSFVPSKDMNTVDALFYCLHKHGRIFPSVIAEIRGTSEENVMKELIQSERVFKNPNSGLFETKEKYLSGDVKKKLQEAIVLSKTDESFIINVKALETVIPSDISIVDISIQFGASWIPEKVIGEFIQEVIYEKEKGESNLIKISYSPLLTQSPWLFKKFCYNDTADEMIWGIPEYPASKLINSLLNNHPIKVEIEIEIENERKLLDYDKTILANQKAEKIKQAFTDWILKDDEKRELLTKIYNDNFNCHVPPQYDGSHFELVNATENINLRPHQKNAVWRGIQEGGGLFDHVVGSGKTMVAIAVIMESKRMGLCSKPMVVVPNSLLYQWRNEFLHLYPNANILVAEKTDFTKENRERLFSRIATGIWDAIIIGHSSFGRIEMPMDEQRAILEEEISLFEKTIIEQKTDGRKKQEVKKLEKKKELLEKNLKELIAKMNRDDRAMNFSDMGIDKLFVDESQEFKNLFFNTGQRVLGLGSPAGSAKAFDLFIKTRYLQRMNGNDSGVYFMTGTSISNTIAEMYTLQRYLQYNSLQNKGIRSFDEWGKIFGKVVTGWELDASGAGYKLVSRFSQFQNVPELQKMYRSIADVITKEDIDKQQKDQSLPPLTPPIRGGKPSGVIAERSGLQKIFMETIIHRFASMPADPREDNPLKATNDARKGGLDFRLISPEAEDHVESKINIAVENIYSIWEKTKKERGTQVVFCDLSTPKRIFSAQDSLEIKLTSPEKNELNISEEVAFIEALKNIENENENNEEKVEEENISNEAGEEETLFSSEFFSVYEDVRDKLIQKGIPREEIAFIHEANTDIEKARLFASVQMGSTRILMGSTKKMGAGVNVQRLLVAAHHLDMPWRPSDLEQRNGRIERQGNKFFEENPDFMIEIYYYLTKQMYDARMCQILQTKANSIQQFRAGDMTQREIKDIRAEAATLAEMKAAASGNPLIFLEVELDTELRRLESLSKQHQKNIHSLKNRIRQVQKFPEIIQDLENTKQECKELLKKYTKTVINDKGETEILHTLTFEDKEYGKENKIAISNLLNKAIGTKHFGSPIYFAEYRGLNIHVINKFYSKECGYQFILTFKNEEVYSPSNLSYFFSEKFSLSGFFTRIDNYLEKDFEKSFDYAIEGYKREYRSLEKLIIEADMQFPEEEQLLITRFNHNDILKQLTSMQKNDSHETCENTWKPIKTLEEIDKRKEKEERKEIIMQDEDEIENEKRRKELFRNRKDFENGFVRILPDCLKLSEYDKKEGDYFYVYRLIKNGNGQIEYMSFNEVDILQKEKRSLRDTIFINEIFYIPEEHLIKFYHMNTKSYEIKQVDERIKKIGINEYKKECEKNLPLLCSYKNFEITMKIINAGERTGFDILVEKEKAEKQQKKNKKDISL